MSVKRFVLLLDPRYPNEAEMLDLLKASPRGERSALLRGLILTGLKEIKKEKARKQFLSQNEHE